MQPLRERILLYMNGFRKLINVLVYTDLNPRLLLRSENRELIRKPNLLTKTALEIRERALILRPDLPTDNH